MALLADTRLRELSGGRQSLDTVLGQLAGCCLPAQSAWSGERLFSRLDELGGHPVFMPLYAELMVRPGMPDLQGLYADLGLLVEGKRVRLLDEGRLVNIRRAIMNGPESGREHSGEL